MLEKHKINGTQIHTILVQAEALKSKGNQQEGSWPKE